MDEKSRKDVLRKLDQRGVKLEDLVESGDIKCKGAENVYSPRLCGPVQLRSAPATASA